MDESPEPSKRSRVEEDSSYIHIGAETFEGREALMVRIREIQAAGEVAELEGMNQALAMALLARHPTMKTEVSFQKGHANRLRFDRFLFMATYSMVKVYSRVRFGEHARFPGSKCFLVTVNRFA